MESENDDVDGTGSPIEEISDGSVLRALRHPDRRFVVRYLSEHGTTDVGTLADVVTGRRSAASGAIQDRTDRETVHLQLVHQHLPALEIADLVEHDRESGLVSPEPPVEEASELLDRIAGREPGNECR